MIQLAALIASAKSEFGARESRLRHDSGPKMQIALRRATACFLCRPMSFAFLGFEVAAVMTWPRFWEFKHCAWSLRWIFGSLLSFDLLHPMASLFDEASPVFCRYLFFAARHR